MDKTIAIRVDQLTYDTINNLAYFEYETMSSICRQLIELGIANLTEKELKEGREQ